jgi:hypothetical protein
VVHTTVVEMQVVDPDIHTPSIDLSYQKEIILILRKNQGMEKGA